MVAPHDILNFEKSVIDSFKKKEILAPVHLDDGNHHQLHAIFSDFNIGKGDWISCTWRSHAKCLLKGVPADELLKTIQRGRSMGLCFPEHRILSSAIVGGNIPIALGLALSEKQQRTKNRVFCFIGDMTAESGIFLECLKYARQHDLPLYFIVEDNGKSVCTPTQTVWNKRVRVPSILEESTNEEFTKESQYYSYCSKNKIIYYQYESSFPHSGVGERITF